LPCQGDGYFPSAEFFLDSALGKMKATHRIFCQTKDFPSAETRKKFQIQGLRTWKVEVWKNAEVWVFVKFTFNMQILTQRTSIERFFLLNSLKRTVAKVRQFQKINFKIREFSKWF